MIAALNRTHAILLIPALLGIMVITLVLSQAGFPEPYLHDEFAYLLGADTLLEGRQTNPTPPAHEFFETFHVNQTPTYHSKYPPGQSLCLAIGKLVFGREIFGVWLTYILTAIALTWALRAVFSWRWSLLGGALSLANATIVVEWAFSFWGGSVAMLGGSLFLGGMLRAYPRRQVGGTVGLCVGLCVMACSRPMEGLLVASLPLLTYAVLILRRHRKRTLGRKYLHTLWFVGATGVVIAVANLAYNTLLTGSAFRFPHMHWQASDASHQVIRQYTGSIPFSAGFKIERFFSAFLGPFLVVFPLVALRRLRDPRVATGMTTVLFVSFCSIVTSRAWPHYIAPVVPMMIALIITGARDVACWTPQKHRLGLIVVGLLFATHAGNELREIALSTQGAQAATRRPINFKQLQDSGLLFKRDLDRFLEEQAGDHLVMVRYLEGHSLRREYVYNRADIPAAKVIWARETNAEDHKQLFQAYPNRHIWLVQLKTVPVAITRVGWTSPANPNPNREPRQHGDQHER